MAIAFPLLKAAHELAHGFAVKRGGGEVHEMGLMFLMFYPVPYVDASGAHAFTGKARRIWVGAAGMAVEMWLAALAFYLWLLLEPGLLRSIAYNVMVLGSISTILFNANPLLRYDGYYMLADAIELPNLGQRATQYWQYLATRYLFGIRSVVPPWATAAERRWFFAYAPLAFVYRIAVTLGIAWFIAQQYFVVGVLIALWSLASGLVLPGARALRALFTDPRFLTRAPRVWGVVWGGGAVVAVLLFVMPMPYHTRVEGVVWLPEKALMRAGGDGFVQRVLAASGAQVREGEVVVETVNPLLAAQLAEQQAKLEEVQVRLDAAWGTRPAEAGRLLEAVSRETAALTRLQEDVTRLLARPQASGQLLIDRAQDLPGQFLRKGDLIGYVVGPHAPIVKVVVAQADVERVLSDALFIDVRLAGALGHPLEGRLSRAVPKAGHELPSAALGQAGGGRNVTNPRDERQVTAIESMFEFEVSLPAQVRADHLGARAYVSFEHRSEPVGWRWLRFARRQLLSKMEV
jgi:putative peptide zinc metalloprotease protein